MNAMIERERKITHKIINFFIHHKSNDVGKQSKTVIRQVYSVHTVQENGNGRERNKTNKRTKSVYHLNNMHYFLSMKSLVSCRMIGFAKTSLRFQFPLYVQKQRSMPRASCNKFIW